MKTVLITGATSGIGEEFARRFAKRGYRLLLAGRNKEKLLELKELYGNDTMLICSDLAEEQNCYDLLEQVKSEKIDVFINNAGFGDCGRFTENDIEKEVKMIKVNDIAMHILFKGMLLKMEQRGRGIILNVASSAGLLPAGPFMATYYASKAYAVSLTRAVAYELKAQNSKVYVCALCPGPVDTNFNEVAKVQFALTSWMLGSRRDQSLCITCVVRILPPGLYSHLSGTMAVSAITSSPVLPVISEMMML